MGVESIQPIQVGAEDILVMGGGNLPPPLLSITCLNDNKEYLIVIYRIKSLFIKLNCLQIVDACYLRSNFLLGVGESGLDSPPVFLKGL